MFQVGNTSDGYVVSCYHDCHWHPLRNFGDRQGDARIFMESDCPKLPLQHLRLLERAYDKNTKYIRETSQRFRKQ